MNVTTLSPVHRAKSYTAKVPGAISGGGGHDRTFEVACLLANGFALPEVEAWELLNEFNQRCSPPWTERELAHKLADAFRVTHDKPRGHLLGPGSPARTFAPARPRILAPRRPVDPVEATRTFLAEFEASEADLWEASPIRPGDDWQTDGQLLLSQLYGPAEMVNIVHDYELDKAGKARPDGRGVTLDRAGMIAALKRGDQFSKAGAWLRMNPTDGKGIADCNVTSFRFALIESDKLPLILQLSLYAKLPLPIAAIMSSGGKSLHAWVRVEAVDGQTYQRDVVRMSALLAKFGIDPKNKNPSRLSRLPGVRRSIEAMGDGRQRLLYLNPDAEQKPILP